MNYLIGILRLLESFILRKISEIRVGGLEIGLEIEHLGYKKWVNKTC